MLTGLLLAVMSSTTPATGPSGARATQSRVRQPTREMAAASIELGDSLAREMIEAGRAARRPAPAGRARCKHELHGRPRPRQHLLAGHVWAAV